MSLPLYTTDLIRELQALYPDKHPSLSDTEREIWFKAGQRSVVNRLLLLQEEANDLPEVLHQ